MSKEIMTFFPGKYRKNSIRRPNFNYASAGYYFFTINTKNRQRFLGTIHNKAIVLSDAGKIVWDCWRAIPSHFPNVKLGAFIVMPDHVHGIVIIGHQTTLGNVIGSFKSAATKKIRETGKPDFGWLR